MLRLAEVCGDVVVVAAPGAEIENLSPQARIVHDPTEGEGPLAGLLAGLLAAARSELALVAAGDMPDLQERVLRELVRVAVETRAEAVILRSGDAPHPLPCVVRTDRATEAAQTLLHAGHRRLLDLFDALRVEVVDEVTWRALDPRARTLFDVDRPPDLIG